MSGMSTCYLAAADGACTVLFVSRRPGMFEELAGSMPFLGHPELPIRNFQRRACRACSMGELRAEIFSKGVDFVVGYVKNKLDVAKPPCI